MSSRCMPIGLASPQAKQWRAPAGSTSSRVVGPPPSGPGRGSPPGWWVGQVGYACRQPRSGGSGLPAVTDDALRRLPKAELHLHLDGSLRPATVEELARELGLVPGDAPYGAAPGRGREPQRVELRLPLHQTKEHLARVTGEMVEDLAADGVVYSELRFCPRLNTERGLTIDEVLATVGEAAGQARG